MARYRGEENYVHGSTARLGVLITNLGTPAAPTARAVWKYLGEFLSDSRVIEIPKLIWWPLLFGVILPLRARPTARGYAKVWQGEDSPLLAISKRQRAALQTALDAAASERIEVELAMRYGQPSISSALRTLQTKNVRRILLLPLYPQYSASTTAATFDAVAKEFRQLRWMPELRMINRYGMEPEYIDACARRIESHWRGRERGQKLILSFHGLPKRSLLLGDPYHCECQQTARLIAAKLGLKDTQWEIAFQSRFGKGKWLKPYTEDRIVALPREEGVFSVDIFCPGFSADCLETLEEIEMNDRKVFLHHGGRAFHYIPALNDAPFHVEALARIVLRHLHGWSVQHISPAEKETLRQRALDLGAKQ